MPLRVFLGSFTLDLRILSEFWSLRVILGTISDIKKVFDPSYVLYGRFQMIYLFYHNIGPLGCNLSLRLL